MLRFAERVESLRPSATLEISAQAQELKKLGHEVISLAAGEPDFNTPEPIRKAATEAMEKGLTRYTPSAGFLALREVIAEKVQRENGFPVKPEEVIITTGAKHAIYTALQCLAQSGDTILLPTPAWVSYGPQIELTGARIFPLPLFEEDGFRPNLDRWKGMRIPENARGIILNSPSNPTGVVFSREDLVKVVGWSLQRNLWILSDEIYEKLLYNGAKHVSVASLGPEVAENTITISGCSKTYAMTGWRLGWAIANQALIKKMSSYQSQSTSNVTSFVQWAAIAAAKLPESYLDEMLSAFDKRRRYCCERLRKMSAHLSFVEPTGAFYLFVNFSKYLQARKISDLEFCKELLEKKYVGLVPGSAFGQKHFVRMSYATSQEQLEKAMDRIEAFLNETTK